MALLPLNSVIAESGKPFEAYSAAVQGTIQTLTMLANGFIVTSLLWATGLSRIIDGRMRWASATFAMAGFAALFGIIHSPLPSSPIVAPGVALRQLAALHREAASASQTPYHWATAYVAVAVVLLVIGRVGQPPSDESGANA
jgi:AGZA family xanthine/uracil permease-like MFS transporter